MVSLRVRFGVGCGSGHGVLLGAGCGVCGVRVPCLIWVLEPVWFGDVMVDWVCPCDECVAAHSFQDLETNVSGFGGIREPATRHQLSLGLGTPRHCSHGFCECGVAEFTQDVMYFACEFA